MNHQRPRVGQVFAALALGCALAGCAARAGPELLIPTTAAADAKRVKILVATNRDRPDPAVNQFTSQRASNLNYAEFIVAIPASHQIGQVELTGPAGFVVVEQKVLTAAVFKNRVSVRRVGKTKQDVTVFVHGYNNNFQESLFRLAQVTADAGFEHPPVLFAWPSQARTIGYAADKDSAANSRDHLAELLTSLAVNPGVNRIRIVAHSMGGLLAVETLTQLRLAGKNTVISRLNVVLAAPDIDADDFLRQLAVIGPLSPPMKILATKDDQALSISTFLAGSRARIGALDITDPRVKEQALRHGVEVIDISQLTTTDRMQHDKFAYLAVLVPRIEATQANRAQTGVFVFDAADATLTSPSD